MQLYVARQPIFDTNRKIIAYELLHRESSSATAYRSQDGDLATSNVIASSFLSYGLDMLTDNKLAFVNFSTTLLVQGIPELFSNEQLVVEILESTEATEEVLTACKALKQAGYTLALDDFVLRPDYEPLIQLADIIKVDFRQSSEEDQRAIIQTYKRHSLRFLAEKVETEAEYLRALQLGYSLFQGYFFARPSIVTTNTVPTNKLSCLQLVNAVYESRPDFKKIAAAIESDVALSLDTIKLVNSAYFARRHKISSIREAVVTLGLDGVRKWIALATLMKIGSDKSDALITQSLIRSKFMEQLALQTTEAAKSGIYSMLGLFSLLDALAGCTFESMLGKLNIADEITSVLIDRDYSQTPGRVYQLMLLYEQGYWDEAAEFAKSLSISFDTIASFYLQSLEWYQDSCGMGSAVKR